EPACDGRGTGSSPCMVSLSRSLAPGGAWGAAWGALTAGPGGGPAGAAGAGGAGTTSAEKRNCSSPIRMTSARCRMRCPPTAVSFTPVDEGQLVVTNLDLVAVQQRGGLGPEPHPVDRDFGSGGGLPDHDLAVRLAQQQGVSGQHARAREGDGAAGVAPQHDFAHRDG